MKYLITGGASFIGVALTKSLLAEGHEVIVVCRRESKSLNNIPQNERVKIVLYEGLTDISSICQQVDFVDVFIHLAWAGTSHEGRHDKKLQDDNIKYSFEAIDIAYQLHSKLFVETGSPAEYGYINTLFTEDTPCHPDNEYGRAKHEFGNMASVKCQKLGIKYIHLRIISIFGETDHAWTLVMSSIRKMLNNEDVELSSCEQLWNFVDIRDAVKQMFLLCQYALNKNDFTSDVFHIGSNDTRKLRSFVEEMYILTGSKSKLLFGNYTPANTVSLNPSMEKTQKATGGFISSRTFGQVVTCIIKNFKNNSYEKN
jgi:nucleoside-diphosphate-sugar epimerase